jgi:hypothetical protein
MNYIFGMNGKIDLEYLKSNIKIDDYCNIRNSKKTKKGRLLKDCPFCTNKWHFMLNDNNSYYSYNCCCQGGDSIDFMREKCGKSFEDLVSEHGLEKKDLVAERADKRIQDAVKFKRKRYIDKAFKYLEGKAKRYIEAGIEGNDNIYFKIVVRLAHLPPESQYIYLRQMFCEYDL